MYFIFLFILSWIWFFMQADKNRLRELFGVALFASFLGLFTDLLMVEYKLWSYHGLSQSIFSIPLILDFSIYPIVSYLFVQNLQFIWGAVWKRTLVWTLFSVMLEWITLKTGGISHHKWWNLWLSCFSDILIYFTLAGIYRFYIPAYLPRHKNLK